ncbi:MAG: hypothetical protein ACLSGW_11535 [Clostridium sp.]
MKVYHTCVPNKQGIQEAYFHEIAWISEFDERVILTVSRALYQ